MCLSFRAVSPRPYPSVYSIHPKKRIVKHLLTLENKMETKVKSRPRGVAKPHPKKPLAIKSCSIIEQSKKCSRGCCEGIDYELIDDNRVPFCGS